MAFWLETRELFQPRERGGVNAGVVRLRRIETGDCGAEREGMLSATLKASRRKLRRVGVRVVFICFFRRCGRA